MMGIGQKHSNGHMVRGIVIVLAAVIVAAVILVLGGKSIFAGAPVDAWEVKITNGATGKTVSLYTDTQTSESAIRDGVINYVKSSDADVESVSLSDQDSVQVSSQKVSTGGQNVLSSTQLMQTIAANHYMEISTVERQVSTNLIAYKSKTVKTAKVRKTTRKVKPGSYGKKVTVNVVKKTNGRTTDSQKVQSKVVKKPKTKVTYIGTGSVTSRRGSLVKGTSGQTVVNFARKYVGNPYRWGGTSLIHGADCSGFVYSVYRHFGVNLPRTGQRYVGKTVSLRNLKPGDELHYSGHVAIYIGNGRVVHAVNPRKGIMVTSMYYTGRPYSATRFVTV